MKKQQAIKSILSLIVMIAAVVSTSSHIKTDAATHVHSDSCYGASHKHTASCYKDYSYNGSVVTHHAYHYYTQYSSTSYENSYSPYNVALSNNSATKTYEYAYRLAEYSSAGDSNGFYVSFGFYTIAIMNEAIYNGTDSTPPDEMSFVKIYLNGNLIQSQTLETTYVNHMGYYSGVLSVSIPGRVWQVGDIISVQLTIPYVQRLESTAIKVDGWYNYDYNFKLVQLQRICNQVGSGDIFQHNCTQATNQNYCHDYGDEYSLNPCNGTITNVTTSSSSWSCNSHRTGGTQMITNGECSNCGPIIIARTATCCQPAETKYTISNGVYIHNTYTTLYTKTCGLEDGASYTVYGTKASYICNKKISSIAPKYSSQTIVR